MPTKQPIAIVFDTFGSVVDWRGSLIADLSAYGAKRGIAVSITGWNSTPICPRRLHL